MKTKKLQESGNGYSVAQDPFAKAAAAQKLADIARKHRKMLKAEYKQARKAFKQARKAAKRALKEAKAAAKALNGKKGGMKVRQKAVARRRGISAPRRRTAVKITQPPPAAEPLSIAAV